MLETLVLSALTVAELTAGESPARVLDLSHWKLTLPVDTPRPGRPDEVKQPDLRSFQDPRHFFVNAAGDGVVFRAPCGGITTKGSRYPRSELREMSPGGTPAAWSTDDAETRTMTAWLAVTAVPPVKKHVVCAQIHDAADDLLMVRLEGKKLLVERNEHGDVLLDPDYRLGTPFEVRISVGEGRARVWYNGALKLDWTVSRPGCYFKASCYSSPTRGKETRRAPTARWWSTASGWTRREPPPGFEAGAAAKAGAAGNL